MSDLALPTRPSPLACPGAAGACVHGTAATERAPPPAGTPTAPSGRGAATPGSGAAPAEGLLALVQAALAQGRFDRCATTVATELAMLFNCERVFVGLSRRRFVRLEAVSHGAHVARDQPLGRAVAAAMDEVMDQGASIQHPPAPTDRPRITRAHAELARSTAASCLLTVPLFIDGLAVGALLFERDAGARFDAATVQRIEAAATTVAPVLLLEHRAQRRGLAGWRGRWCADPAAATRRRIPGWLAVLAGTSALAALLAAPWPYDVTATTRLEGRIQRAIAAPVDGYLKSVRVRPGDSVRAGELLAELNDEDLRLERRRWEAEVARHQNSYADAQARQDRTQLVVADARVAESRAQLALVEQQLTRTQLVAPFDALVLQGDLAQQLGAPVRRGDLLFTLAPSTELRVMLDVDPRDVAEIEPGLRGAVTLSAVPDQRFDLVVERLMPVASAAGGRHVFQAEAHLEPVTPVDAALLRPGMQGLARLQAGQRPLYWTLTHRLADWLRLQWWTWVG